MVRRPPRSTHCISSAASDVYKRQVVVDDVSPVVRTGDVDRIRYRGSGVVGVPKTQHSVLFVCCVGDVHGESQ